MKQPRKKLTMLDTRSIEMMAATAATRIRKADRP